MFHSPKVIYLVDLFEMCSNYNFQFRFTVRKERVEYTQNQVRILQSFFDQDNYPTKSVLAHLATLVDREPREVSIWFQNRRQNIKKNKLKAQSQNTSNSISNDNYLENSKQIFAELSAVMNPGSLASNIELRGHQSPSPDFNASNDLRVNCQSQPWQFWSHDAVPDYYFGSVGTFPVHAGHSSAQKDNILSDQLRLLENLDCDSLKRELQVWCNGLSWI